MITPRFMNDNIARFVTQMAGSWKQVDTACFWWTVFTSKSEFSEKIIKVVI